MFPYLFKIGNFELRIYSLMYIIAIFIGLFFIKKRAKSLHQDPGIIENIIIVSFFGGIIGARLYYVLLRWDFYSQYPYEIIAFWHGGLAIHGGLIGGVLTGYLYAWKRYNFLYLSDLILPFLLLGQGIGRFGNFANGEAHGVPTITPPDIIFRFKNIFPEFWRVVKSTFNLPDGVEGMNLLNSMLEQKKVLIVEFQNRVYELKEYVPFGVRFPSKYNPPAYLEFGYLPVHPTFFYEMILNFIGAAILIYFWKKDEQIGKGVITGLYLIFYGVIRGFVTTFRADDLMVGYFRAPHIVSFVLILIGGLLIYFRKMRGNNG
ncbi:prolipoprotein diacylglyceryl transferase [Calditerrivibrio nitroreducens]|uniref:Phosphatidylglycerol--prolipoprotein diacylglyceryl transferase n=1 Tax=Calditerrivibrio nitroreducens (strain DSM 19672 / NBRC 101217 / Yu37-1) TaxID=768670 RepID=E4TJJ7_CALNY|nr:prolipoprotein diacylglyceryl transferase [Calditerrivibrio nitroreducens]ADR18159.1 prolipoprotein diacylglyceryl transferase [Calditerrivibrio nitroreducens DSM 19672]